MSRKIAIITGGSRGIGKAIALRLARSGIDSVITYKSSQAEAGQVVRQIEALGARAVAVILVAGLREIGFHQGVSKRRIIIIGKVLGVAFGLWPNWSSHRLDTTTPGSNTIYGVNFALKRPITRILHQVRADRIAPDVIPFLCIAFVVPQKMIEKPRLPEAL
jgi:hypothetical protein